MVGPAFAQNGADYFPLEKGNFWIYRGEVSWVQRNPATDENEIKKQTLTWKMEVVDTARRGKYFGALIKGMPNDLSWYESEKPRGDYLILREGGTKYFLLRGNKAKAAFAILQTGNEPLEKLTEWYEIILDLPLRQGNTFGGDPESTRSDRYCWVVEGAENPFDSSTVKGAPSEAKREFFLTYRTGPDHQFLDFVPNLGIVNYTYGHHGTVSECDMALVEFGTANGKASQEKKTQ